MKALKNIALLIVGSFLAFSIKPVAAQPASGLIANSTPNLQSSSDPAEIESFMDNLFKQQMVEYHIAGITAVMVKDGQVLYQKGYGYSDLERQIPVDPTTTLFRIGSVTKLFTWTAVLQLYEQGKLDLNADIDIYLDFHIPDTFPEPITLKHLMSHTAGFEDRLYEIGATSPDQLQPLGMYLATHIPARVRPVGQISAYSNYGTDLAGYIVERISGMPYADYIESYILEPLGMDQTTAKQPLPVGLAMNMSNGYHFQKNTSQPGFFELLSTQPSGAISSTSADMARFMIACMDGGLFSHESTKQLMQSRLWSYDPRLTGFTYGFWELQSHGQRILFHPGATNQFHSLFMLIPDQRLGLFFSFNTDTALNLWDKTLYDILDHYFPFQEDISAVPVDFDARASHFAGTYHLARSSYTTIEKVNHLLEEWVVVRPSGDGALLFGSPLQPQKVRLVESQPLVFVESQYGVQLVFLEDDQGRITHLIDLHMPAQAYEKVSWVANPSFHYILLIVCSVLFLSAILTGIAGSIIYFFRKGHSQSQILFARLAHWLSFVISAIFLFALVGFAVIYLDSNGFDFMVGFGQMSTINLILAAWLAGAILTVGLIAFAAFAWIKRYWSTASRIHYTVVTLAALAFVWFLNYWNLLGFRY